MQRYWQVLRLQRLNTPADSNSMAETFEAFQFHTRRHADTPIPLPLWLRIRRVVSLR